MMGADISDISKFVREEVHYPEASRRPPDSAQRLRQDCMHSFAGETLSMLSGLALWNKIKLRPTGKLPRHSECLERLVRVIDLLQMGDKVVKRVADLKLAIREYIFMYTELYPDLRTPKGVHFPYHFPEQIERHEVNLSTFAPERKHKIGKITQTTCSTSSSSILV